MTKHAYLLLIMAVAGLVSCAGNAADVNFQKDGFSFKAMKNEKLTLVLPYKVRVTEFRNSFQNAFGSEDSCILFMARAISDSVKRLEKSGGKIIAGMAYSGGFDHDEKDERMFEESADPKYRVETDSVFHRSETRYILTVKNIEISELTPTANGYSVVSSAEGIGESQGSSHRCVVTFDVDIWEKDKKRKVAGLSFKGECPVILFAYEAALKSAMINCLNMFVGFVKQLKA